MINTNTSPLKLVSGLPMVGNLAPQSENVALMKIYLTDDELCYAAADFVKYTEELHSLLSNGISYADDTSMRMTALKIVHYITTNKLSSVNINDVDFNKGTLIVTGRY